MRKKAVLLKLIYLGMALCLMVSMTTSGWAQGKATPTQPAQPKYGGVLRIGTGIDANRLGNPPDMLTVQDFIISKTCIESLARYDEKGLMVPWLAESWTTDAKAKTITLKLKKGIKFHDGTDFNAAACKWNIEKFINAKRAEFPPVTSIDIVDNYTLKINLVNWDNTAIIGMGYFAGPMISPAAWQKGGSTDQERNDWANKNPIGTGPFQFVSWQREVKQVYKKFDGYWQKGKPYLDGVEWNLVKDPMVLQASFRANEQDIVYLLTPLIARDLKASGFNIIELKTGLGLLMLGMMPNSAMPDSPFTNLKTRQAISYAVDTKAILDSQFFGFGVATQQWGVPNGYWANPNFKGYPYSPEKAKQLVVEAGYPNGFKTKMLTLSDPENMAVATAIQGMLTKANINVELDVADNARYRQLTSQTNFEGMCWARFRADSDPAMVMPRNLSASGTIMVKSIMHPEKIEKLLVEAKQAPDQLSKRAKIWELQQVTFGEYSIFSPMIVPSGLAAKKPFVHGDGFMTIEQTQWTPEDAWLDK